MMLMPTTIDVMPVQFVCTLSPLLRAAAQVAGEVAQMQLARTAHDTAQQIDSLPEVAQSLKGPSVTNGKGRIQYMRQTDIREGAEGTCAPGDGKIVLKAYTRWYEPYNCWHVMLELPQENHWCQQVIDEAQN
jgi:hypothetical protein